MPKRAEDYSRGVIYKIVNSVDDREYFGSTAQKYRSKRWAKHKYEAKNGNPASVYQHMRKVGIDNCRMVLLEKYPCNDQEELEIREEWWRQQSKQKALNERRCHLTNKQKREENIIKCKNYRQHKFTCACGGTCTKQNKSRHIKSKKHQRWAKDNPTLTEYSQFLTRVTETSESQNAQ